MYIKVLFNFLIKCAKMFTIHDHTGRHVYRIIYIHNGAERAAGVIAGSFAVLIDKEETGLFFFFWICYNRRIKRKRAFL